MLELFSAAVGHGIVGCLGDWDQVAEDRRANAHLENVMFTPGDLEEIPWQESFFSQVKDPVMVPERICALAMDPARNRSNDSL